MLQIKMQPTLSIQDILEEFEIESIHTFFFTEEVQNGAFYWFETDIDALIDTQKNIEALERYNDTEIMQEVRRKKNDLRLIQLLREMGYSQGVLIEVWW